LGTENCLRHEKR